MSVSLWKRNVTDLGWVGVDLDGTLAMWTDNWPEIGDPVPAMLELVKDLLDNGREVRILTARVGHLYTHEASRGQWLDALDQKDRVMAWVRKHVGRDLEITAVKDYDMDLLYDDRVITVEKNTGRILTKDTK
jgi:hypothetical protein